MAKDKVNKQQGFKFRSVDDVYNALHPALAKTKCLLYREFLSRPGKLSQQKWYEDDACYL